VRERIEAGLERWGHAVARRPVLAILLSILFAVSWASQLPKLGVETAVEAFLPLDWPARIAYDEFREQFGREELIIVALKPPEVFDLAFLRELREIHHEIESEVPHLDDVQSLVNARATYGREDELVVEDLLEEFPETPAEVARLRERVLANPLYTNLMISEDGRFTSIVIQQQLYSSSVDSDDPLAGFDSDLNFEDDATTSVTPPFLTGEERDEGIDKIIEIVERHRSDQLSISIAGAPVMNQAITGQMQADLQRFIALMMGAIALVLFSLFRRLSGVFLPLLIVILALASTVGMMASAGVKLSPPSQVLPTFLLAVGTGAAVHLLKIFYLRFDAGESAEDSIAYSLGHSGLPVGMTCLTTMGGLLSFTAAGLVPIVDLGTYAPIGILLILIYSLVLLPALVCVLPLRRKALQGGKPREGLLDHSIVRIGDYSVRHPRTMVAVAVVILAFSISGAVRLQFSNDVMAWLPPGDPLRTATSLIDRELRGSMTLEVMADTGRENGVKSPTFLKGLDTLRERTGSLTRGDYLFVGKTIAISDVLKEIHQALNENRPAYYAIPDDEALVSQELLLFENTGTDDLEDFVDTRFQLARFTLKVPYADPMRYDGFIQDVEAEFQAVLGDSAEVSTTGFMAMMGETVSLVIFGMGRSYVLAVLIITPLMILLIGNLRGGLVSMVPNLTPILLTLGIMGWAEIPIEMFTMMIGGIALGLAVDDTIHFIHGFRRSFLRLGDARAAVRETLETTGRALLVTSIVLASGFAVFAFSEMSALVTFGVLTSFTIAMAFLIDITITPALMGLVSRNQEREPIEAGEAGALP
jgi:predicted RND superfamily exporter protein